MGKRLKQNVDAVQANIVKLYSKLANMAFWDAEDKADAEPTPLDWGNPKHTVTLALNLTNAVVKHNGVAKANGDTIQVEEGSTVTLTVEPASGYALTSVQSSTTGATVTDLSNGTYSVAIAVAGADMTLSITATAAAARSVTLNLTGCSKTSGPTSIINGGGGTFVFAADEDYTLPTSNPTVTNATVTSWDSTTGTLVISGVSGDVTITVTATSPWLTAPKDDVTEGGNVVTYGMQQGRSINPNSGYAAPGLTSGNPTVILSPAAYPYDTKVFTSGTSGYNANTNPGKTTNCFFATGGKRYLKIKMEFNSSEQTTGYDYKVAVACYTSSVLNNSQPDTTGSSISGIVGRIQYAVGNVTTFEWKLDLNTFATENGKQAGDIAYVKLLMCKYQEGSSTALDSRTWIDNMALKYYFTDD